MLNPHEHHTHSTKKIYYCIPKKNFNNAASIIIIRFTFTTHKIIYNTCIFSTVQTEVQTYNSDTSSNSLILNNIVMYVYMVTLYTWYITLFTHVQKPTIIIMATCTYQVLKRLTCKIFICLLLKSKQILLIMDFYRFETSVAEGVISGIYRDSVVTHTHKQTDYYNPPPIYAQVNYSSLS